MMRLLASAALAAAILLRFVAPTIELEAIDLHAIGVQLQDATQPQHGHGLTVWAR